MGLFYNTTIKAFFLLFFFINILIGQTDNVAIKKLYDEDQSERNKSLINFKNLCENDNIRFEKAKQILNKKNAKTSNDYYYLAMIFHHTSGTENYKLAYELCQKAINLNSSNKKARWLYAASMDRFLMSRGKPQIYCTQGDRLIDFIVLREPYDTNTVNNSERKYYGVMTTKEIKKNNEKVKEYFTKHKIN